MHPKTKPKPTVHLANWCRVRCSVSHTTSWTGLSTSLATTPTPARLWQWKHLQGMHEHHIFHSPNAHKQKTYIMHIFPNMSFFHSYLHLQQLQIASVHATLHLWLTTIPSVCLDGIYDFSNTYHTSSRPLEVKTPANMHEHHIFHTPNAHQQKTYTMHIFPNISFFHNYLHLHQLQMKHKQQPQWPSFINKLTMNKTHIVYSFPNTNQTSTLPHTRIHLAYLHMYM